MTRDPHAATASLELENGQPVALLELPPDFLTAPEVIVWRGDVYVYAPALAGRSRGGSTASKPKA